MSHTIILHAGRLCEQCKPVQFDDTAHDGQSIINGKALNLDISSANPRIMKGFNTMIGEHLSLHLFDLTDSYPDLPKLSSSAKHCGFCSFIKDCLLSKDVFCAVTDHGVDLNKEKFQLGIRLSYSWEPKGGEQGVGLDALYLYLLNADSTFSKSVARGLSLEQGPFCSVRLTAFRRKSSGSKPPIVQWLRLRELAIASGLDPSTQSWMKQKLANCERGEKEHSSCISFHKKWAMDRPTKRSYPWLPTRLIDVSNETIRLVAASALKLKEAPQYIALSYCWGLEDDARLQLTTTAETKLARKQSIAFSDLSSVQQDAVVAARAMSVRYLWIDALCIVQGDRNDWEKESQRMGHIYSYAYFTIVSLMPSNQSKFLEAEVPEVDVSLRSALAETGEVQGQTFTLRFDHVETAASGTQRLTKWAPSLSPNRWVTRGWTFQEQVLSPRTFMFGPAGVRFVCLSASYTILAKEAPPRSFVNTIHKFSMNAASAEEGYEKWRDFARDFSGRGFSKQTDRFPAIAGLAKLFAKKMRIEGQYLAGIWRRDMVKGLLWRYLAQNPKRNSIVQLLKELSSSSDYIGPSWSWIDRFSVTFFCWDDAVNDCDLWKEEFHVVNPEAFGRHYGELKMEQGVGLAVTTRLLRIESDAEMHFDEDGEQPDNNLSIATRNARFRCKMDWNVRDWVAHSTTDELKQVSFALLASVKAAGSSSAVVGLVLHPIDYKRSEAAFLRVGIFHSAANEGGVECFSGRNVDTKTIRIV